MLRSVRAALLAVLILTIGIVEASMRAPLPRGGEAQGEARQGSVPTPASVLGFAPCSDYKLATYEQIGDYFRKLDAASERMQLLEIGKTAEGRTQLMSIISSEANMKQLSRYKEIARALALNRDEQGRPLTDERAAQLAQEGKAVIWIDFGLHATEVAHGQTAPWMAWRAVTEETDEMKFIRDNVIFILVPNMNPDGGTLVADWYMTHVGKPWEMRLPELYQKYVGHDNNRDWFMFNQAESRNSARQLYHEWFPQIVYNQHQTAPFPARIFVPPFEDPSNFNIPPLVLRGINAVGDAMTRRLDQEGKVGAVSRLQFDTWWNGGMRTAPYFHNMVGILTETAHATATPADYDVKSFPKRFANGESTTEPSTYYPSPYLGGHWTIKMSCEYMNTASMAVLDIGAKRREEWLFDIYQMARDHMEAGAQETYVVPAEQWDPGAAARMINVLRLGGVEVERATAPFTAGGKQYAVGSFVIQGAQPCLPYVRDLLTPQVYPDRRLYPDGPPEQPYDITGWTLNLQMGVTVDKIAEAVTAQTEPVEEVSLASDAVPAAAEGAYLIDPRTNEAFIAVNRLLKEGEIVHRATAPINANGQQWPAGAFVVMAGQETHDRIKATAALGLSPVALDNAPQGELMRVEPPRIGLYNAWGGNMDEGWTRWVLEQYEFPYTTIRDKDIRAGDLGKRFDVIVLPDATYDSMLKGFAPGSMPDEYVGGMTPRGVANLYTFAAEGGTLVALDTASELPLQAFGLPVRDVLADLRENEFFCPGTILKIDVDNSHPVAWGMPEEAAAFFAGSPAFDVGYRRGRSRAPEEAAPTPPANVKIVASYPGEDALMSGWLLGESYLHEKAAALEATVERGRVVMLGFRVQHRGQPHGTFKLLFNSLLLGGSEAAEGATSSSSSRN
ncbi:MAG: peptidase M14 [Luteitalea sp.]|nr:peptidase M14 [Luteitalea sp.]